MNYNDLEKYITKERLETYLINAKNSGSRAVDLYEWNTRISESLYTPLSYFEITLRNICNERFRKEFGENWCFNNHLLSGNNPEKGKWAINKITEAENKVKRRKSEKGILNYNIKLGDIISNLELSFWSNLFCANYNHNMWKPHLKYLFPNKERKELFKQIDSIRELRNRIFHHEPIIFDNNLENKYKLIIELLCIATNLQVCEYVRSQSNFEKIFQEYEKIRI